MDHIEALTYCSKWGVNPIYMCLWCSVLGMSVILIIWLSFGLIQAALRERRHHNKIKPMAYKRWFR
jgi:hypothetical protein